MQNNSIDLSHTWIVIAAYNEELMVGKTVTNLITYIDNIIVVDDCSKDNTAQEAHHAGAHVLHHPINLGQGGALQTGIDYALKKGANYIVTFDADGQHTPDEIIPMLLSLQKSKAQIALGSRFLKQSFTLPWQRHLILKLAILFTQFTNHIKLTDVHNGFRIMTRYFCEGFSFQQNRMAHASEILKHIAKYKIKFIEFPVTVTYTDYSLKKGQKNSNAIRILMELLMGHISK